MSPDLDAPVIHPINTICLWHGLIVNIPKGWFLCDGNDGTENLSSRFIRGAPNVTDAGATGGEDTSTLTTAQIPVHTHSFSDPTHQHFVGNRGGDIPNISGVASGRFDQSGRLMNATTSNITVGDFGGDGSHENRPLFYEIAYIQRRN